MIHFIDHIDPDAQDDYGALDECRESIRFDRRNDKLARGVFYGLLFTLTIGIIVFLALILFT